MREKIAGGVAVIRIGGMAQHRRYRLQADVWRSGSPQPGSRSRTRASAINSTRTGWKRSTEKLDEAEAKLLAQDKGQSKDRVKGGFSE